MVLFFSFEVLFEHPYWLTLRKRDYAGRTLINRRNGELLETLFSSESALFKLLVNAAELRAHLTIQQKLEVFQF
jgi:hypothetical protein